ncbi:ComF family protein, partial [Vibrio parahaemolyticus]|nr:ComF family protein [Vibrio parahaemolyticus]
YQLKYKDDFTQCAPVAKSLYANIIPYLAEIHLIIAIPPSKACSQQPVPEIARELAILTKLPFIDRFLIKSKETPQMKDIESRADKIAALQQSIQINVPLVNQTLPSTGYNVLIVDDLYDTGT